MNKPNVVSLTPAAAATVELGEYGPEMPFVSGHMGQAQNRLAEVRKRAPELAAPVAKYETDIFARLSGGSPEERRAKIALFMRKQRLRFAELYEAAVTSANDRAQALRAEWAAHRRKLVAEDPLVGPLLQRIAAGLTPEQREAWTRSEDPSVRLALAAAPSELSGVNWMTKERLDRALLEHWRPDIAVEANDLVERMVQVEQVKAGFDRALAKTMDVHEERALAERAEAEGITP